MDATTKPKRKSGASSSSSAKTSYPDLHDHIAALEKAGQLIRVDRPINKDTEMHPLVRWQFRGGIEKRTARRSCSPTSSTRRAANTTFPFWSATSSQPRDLPHRRQLPL